jgi:hypothetical protein
VESEHDKPKQAEAAPPAPQAAQPARQAAPESKTPGVSRGKIYLVLAVAAVIVFAAYFATRRSTLISTAASPATSAAITLVTSDRTDLDCVARKGIQGFNCGFSTEIVTWQGDEQNKLKPYYTLDRHLYLIPGLFLEPAIAKRYMADPPNKPREQLKRFTARCQIKVIGKLTGVRTRWLANTAWSNPEDIDVATAKDCKVEG